MTKKQLFLFTLPVFILLLLVSYVSYAMNNSLILTQNGCTDYKIVLTRDASPSEKHAVKELQMFLKMISGVTIPIYRDNENVSGPMILVGDGPLLRQIDSNIDFKDLGDEGFVIRTNGSNLILAGGRLRGTMYAVYSFLSDVLGCKWYTHEKSFIPQMTTIKVEPLNIKEKPGFEMRLLNAKDATVDPDWAARNKLNSGTNFGVARGGQVITLVSHSYYHLVSPYIYFADHPEYYSQLNGKRQWEYAQLCTTHPEVAKIAALSINEWIERSPEAGFFGVCQEDWNNWCTCGHCETLNKHEESPAGGNIYLVNAVAEIVEKTHPEKWVGTFAYMYTEKAPKYIRPRKNVNIRMALIQGCDAHPLDLCPNNEKVAQNVKDWGPLAKSVHVWDYTNDFTHLLQPFPNWWSNSEDLKFFKRNGITGVFMQGCSFTESGALEELQVYVQAQLLWNPDRDVWKIIDEFLNGYYGPAAPAMRRYVDLLQNIVKNMDNHFTLFSPVTEAFNQPDVIHEAEKILDEAERAAQGRPDILYVLAQNRLCIRYIKMTQTIDHVRAGDAFKPDMTTAAYNDINLRELSNFMEDCNDLEVTALNEWGQMFTRYQYMLTNLGTHSLVPIENDRLKIEFIPTLGGRIFSIYDKKRNEDRLMQYQMLKSVSGGRGGSFMSGGLGFGMANQEIFYPKISKDSDGQRMIFTGYLDNNGHALTHNSFLETREIFLPQGKAEIQVTQKLNALLPIQRPQSTSASPMFKLGNVKDLKIGALNEKGTYDWVTISSEPIEPGRRGGMGRMGHMFGEREIRGGSVIVINPVENIGVVLTFDPSQIRSCGVYVNTERNVVSVGMQGKQITYKQGDEQVIKYKYTFVDNAKEMVR